VHALRIDEPHLARRERARVARRALSAHAQRPGARPALDRSRGREKARVAAVQEGEPVIDRLAIDAAGGAAPADAAAALDQPRRHAALGERARAGEAGQPCAEDDDGLLQAPGE